MGVLNPFTFTPSILIILEHISATLFSIFPFTITSFLFFKDLFWWGPFLKSLRNLLHHCFHCLCFGLLASRHVGSQLPDQGSNSLPNSLHPLPPSHWKAKSQPLDWQGSPDYTFFFFPKFPNLHLLYGIFSQLKIWTINCTEHLMKPRPFLFPIFPLFVLHSLLYIFCIIAHEWLCMFWFPLCSFHITYPLFSSSDIISTSTWYHQLHSCPAWTLFFPSSPTSNITSCPVNSSS